MITMGWEQITGYFSQYTRVTTLLDQQKGDIRLNGDISRWQIWFIFIIFAGFLSFFSPFLVDTHVPNSLDGAETKVQIWKYAGVNHFKKIFKILIFQNQFLSIALNSNGCQQWNCYNQ